MKKEKPSLWNLLDPEFLSEKADDLSVKFEKKAKDINKANPFYIPKPKNPLKHWARDRRIEKREKNKKNKE